MPDKLPREKFVVPLGEVLLVKEPDVPADASFWEWMVKTWREDQGKPADMPLCAGARITIDENGEGVLVIDESLPDGVWIVSHPDKSYRLTGVTGPVRVESKAEDTGDIERSPVALTFETRK